MYNLFCLFIGAIEPLCATYSSSMLTLCKGVHVLRFGLNHSIQVTGQTTNINIIGIVINITGLIMELLAVFHRTHRGH